MNSARSLIRGDIADTQRPLSSSRRSRAGKIRSLFSFRSRSEPTRSCAPTFFRYSNRVISSSGPSMPQKFTSSAPGRCGMRRMKYFFNPANRCARSLHFGQAFEIEVAAGGDADNGLALRFRSVQVRAARRRTGRPQVPARCPSTFSISSIVMQMRSSGRQHGRHRAMTQSSIR